MCLIYLCQSQDIQFIWQISCFVIYELNKKFNAVPFHCYFQLDQKIDEQFANFSFFFLFFFCAKRQNIDLNVAQTRTIIWVFYSFILFFYKNLSRNIFSFQNKVKLICTRDVFSLQNQNLPAISIRFNFVPQVIFPTSNYNKKNIRFKVKPSCFHELAQ